jgi:hypothetical protein
MTIAILVKYLRDFACDDFSENISTTKQRLKKL